jgi:FtsH-binding integral membrane protein
MDQQLQGMFGASSDMLAVRHRVLRNTYWLLALSMIPTVIGAWLGLQSTLPLGSPYFSALPFSWD